MDALGFCPASVEPEILIGWFSEQSDWKPETRRGYRNTIRSFYWWAYHTGHIERPDLAQVLPPVKASVPAPRPAPDDIWQQAFEFADPRVGLMLRLAGEGGLRRAEVAKVSTTDVIEGIGGPLLIVHGKGDKQRIIPITAELAEAISAGANGHTPGASPCGWLFPGSEDGHLSPRWVGKLCTKVLADAWTMHALRHRFAAKAYRGTRNLRAIQQLLGHASVATTERYTAVDDDEMRAAMMAAVA